MQAITKWLAAAALTAAVCVAAGAAPVAAAHPVGRGGDPYFVPISYEIELKAWIPFQEVVDPERLLTIPYLSNLEGNCFTAPSFGDALRTTVSSFYRGDGHVPYPGTFRVSSTIRFVWDGGAISGLTASGSYGTTHRDLVYHTPSGDVTCNIAAATATSAASGSGSGSTFQVSYSSKNPLVFPELVAPAIDSDVTGSVDPNGTLTLSFADDLFPSHGIQIVRDGAPALTDTIGDASCLGADNVVGLGGAAILAWGLTHQDNRGTLRVTPLAKGIVLSAPSRLCSQTLWGTIVSGASGLPAADASAARAGPRVRIAPVNGGVVGPAMSLGDAQNAGLVSVSPTDAGTLITSDSAHPVQITASGSHVVLRTIEIVGGHSQRQHVYGPFTGTAVVNAGSRAVVSANGKPATPHAPSRQRPATRASLRLHGKRAIVRFHVSDPAGLAYTRAYVGARRLGLRRGKVTVARSKLPKLRFYSVDPLGNVERAHGLSARQLRRAGINPTRS